MMSSRLRSLKFMQDKPAPPPNNTPVPAVVTLPPPAPTQSPNPTVSFPNITAPAASSVATTTAVPSGSARHRSSKGGNGSSKTGGKSSKHHPQGSSHSRRDGRGGIPQGSPPGPGPGVGGSPLMASMAVNSSPRLTPLGPPGVSGENERTLSSKITSMNFMKRKGDEDASKTIDQQGPSEWLKTDGMVMLEELAAPMPVHVASTIASSRQPIGRMGRRSFGGFNPAVEKYQGLTRQRSEEKKKLALQECAVCQSKACKSRVQRKQPASGSIGSEGEKERYATPGGGVSNGNGNGNGVSASTNYVVSSGVGNGIGGSSGKPTSHSNGSSRDICPCGCVSIFEGECGRFLESIRVYVREKPVGWANGTGGADSALGTNGLRAEQPSEESEGS